METLSNSGSSSENGGSSSHRKRKAATSNVVARAKKLAPESGFMRIYRIDGDPFVGKIRELGEGVVTLEQYYKCPAEGKWLPLCLLDKPYAVTVSENALIDDIAPFRLTSAKRLPGKVQTEFKLLLK